MSGDFGKAESGRGDRRARRKAEQSHGVPQPPWAPIRNPMPPLALLDEEGLRRIDDTSLRVIEELGVEFLHEGALDAFARAGAQVDRATSLVRMERAMVRELVGKAPRRFKLHARNPERTLTLGDNTINIGPVGSPPNCSDLDRGRRPGAFADQVNLIKLHQALTCVHHSGGTPVEALDLPPESRHLDLYRAHSIYSDRAFMARSIGRDRVLDAIEIAALARGISKERLDAEPTLMTVLNVNSPRRVDKELLTGMMAMIEHGQAVCVTPFTLAGAMSPVTIAGALAQQSAEALAVIALMQILRPGTPAMFGGFTSNVDMKSGAPAFGTPEYVRATIIGGQIARRWGLPYRSSNVNASNCVDAQATYESAMSIWACVLAHAHFVHHGTGWLEGGLVASFEKSVVDAEMLHGMRAWLEPLDLSDDALAFDALKEVPPGGHFFGAAHTMARYETAFYRPLISDWRNFQSWVEAGSQTATQRANATWKKLLESYVEPPMD
ncbi:MAG: trimethylamine methyltransferase family protein, partial [Alphaproteobacteria bacterium]|nr:trimethylamine methyltransferase family protein [Alphaproteobacteria bacterium]